jgi:Protein of unknown function (DUF1559)
MRRHHSSIRLARPGLSLLEVLVIVVLALIALGVLISFMQQSRETSRRAHCMNNLKLMGEAIFYYEGTREHLLAARLKDARGPAQGTLPAARIADGYATWAVQIAPYLRGDDPLKAWDLQKPYFDQSAEARETSLPVFLCPARIRTSTLSVSGDTRPDGTNVPGAVGDYACAAGDGDPRHAWTGSDANGAIILGEVLHQEGDRILAWRSRTTLSSLKRGLSNTILLGEKHVPTGAFGQASSGDGSLYNGANPASFSRIGGPGYGLAPSPTAPFNQNFGSSHPGLCQFLMADISVRPMSNEISEEVLGKLIQRE